MTAVDPRLRPTFTPSVDPAALETSGVLGRLRRELANGVALRADGLAKEEPEALLSGRTRPRFAFELFGRRIALSGPLQDDYIGFAVAYVGPEPGERAIRPRVFYRDLSLVWRSATHLVRTPDETWIGKGALRSYREGDEVVAHTAEETTDLPFEMQAVLDHAALLVQIARDARATERVLRNAPAGRLEPYRDFTAPRERDMAVASVHRGRPIARFRRMDDPESLAYAKGFEPDLVGGVVEIGAPRASKFYGGEVRAFRVLSVNRRIQHLFFHSPAHTWLAPPQARTSRVSTFGTRTVDVVAPEELFIPGFEYHHEVDGELHSQIPPGFAGAQHPDDPNRADASPWNHALAPIRAFRRQVPTRVVKPA